MGRLCSYLYWDKERERGVQRSWLGCVVIFEWDKDRSMYKEVGFA
jgi:hypothetical protein